MEIRSVTDRLSVAASLLDAVAADLGHVSAEVAVECLFAAEQLEVSGAHSVSVDLYDDPRSRLRRAMAELAALDDDALSRPLVLAAARATRHAYRGLD